MEETIDEIKPIIRSILLAASGRRASEKEFRRDYYEQQGESFKTVLEKFGMSFYQVMRSMTDVCQVLRIGDEVYVQRVAAEESSHLDLMTAGKKRKKSKKLTSYTSRYGPSRFNSYQVNKPFTSNNTIRSTIPFNPTSRNPLTSQVRKFNQTNIAKNSSWNPSIGKKYNQYASEVKQLPPPPHANLPKIVYKATETENQSIKNSSSHLPPLPHQLTRKIFFKPDTTSDNQDENSVKRQDSLINKQTENVQNVIPLELPEIDEVEVKQEHANAINHKTCLFETRRVVLTDGSSSSAWSDVECDTSIDFGFGKSATGQDDVSDKKSLAVAMKKLSKIAKIKKVKSPSQQVSPGLSTEDISDGMSLENFAVNLQNYVTEPFEIPQPQVRVTAFQMSFEVKIQEVMSPGKFIFQFKLKELSQMIAEMNLHYNAVKKIQELKVHRVVAGMSVAALDEERWHRVEVLCVSGGHIFGLFVDTGATKYIKKTRLRYLEKTFAEQSRKACKGSIFGVKPKDGRILWDLKVVRQFSLKTKNICLMASVNRIEEARCYSLTLTFNHSDVAQFMISKDLGDPSNENRDMNAILN